jgi:hypothetical protein
VRSLFAALVLCASTAFADPIETGRLIFHPGAGLDRVTAALAKTGEQDRTSVSLDLGRDYDGLTDIYVVANRADFEAVLPPRAVVPTWADGVAFPLHNLVIVRVQPGGDPPRATLRHELSHIAVGRLTHGLVPRWFLEGLATIRAGDAWSREGRSLILAGLSNDLIPFGALDTGFPERPSDAELAYAESAAFVQYLLDQSSEAALQDVLRRVVAGATFEDAMTSVMGSSPRRLENAWRRSLDKWILGLDLVMNRDFFWMVLSFLVIFGAWKVRRRRLARLSHLEKEEQAEAARLFVRAPAVWADGPPVVKAAEPVTVAPLVAEPAEPQVIPDPGDDHSDSQPKKPTLH